MNATFVKQGNTINHTPGSAVSAGDIVVVNGNFVGIANSPISSGVQGLSGDHGHLRHRQGRHQRPDLRGGRSGVLGCQRRLAVTEPTSDSVFMGFAEKPPARTRRRCGRASPPSARKRPSPIRWRTSRREPTSAPVRSSRCPRAGSSPASSSWARPAARASTTQHLGLDDPRRVGHDRHLPRSTPPTHSLRRRPRPALAP